MELRDRVKNYMTHNGLSQSEMAQMANTSQPTISQFLNGIHDIRKETRINLESIVYPKKLVYTLSIERDGVVKYCYSYSPEISPETIYWDSAENDRMSLPFGFRSHKQAEWLFWQWKNRSGQEGWHFNIKEVAI